MCFVSYPKKNSLSSALTLFCLQVAEIFKDRISWYRDCRCLDVASIVPAGNGGTIEIIYMQVCFFVNYMLVLTEIYLAIYLIEH